MIAKVNFIPSRIVFDIPELRLEMTSAGRLIAIPLTLAAMASNIISTINVGIA
jgi:hypothetical protein